MDRAWFDKQTLGSLPERAARRWGAREALFFEGRRWSFAELSAGVDRVGRGLMALGVAPGETVALWMLNRPEWIEAMYAVLKRRHPPAHQYALSLQRRGLRARSLRGFDPPARRAIGPHRLSRHGRGD